MDLVPGKYKDPLCYEFVVSCLGAVNFYEALSYAWGDTARSHHDLIRDHHQLQINANLDSALRRLRHPETYCRLWVDAICVYPDRHRTKCCRNLRFELLLCEGIGFAHLACRIGKAFFGAWRIRDTVAFSALGLFRSKKPYLQLALPSYD
jgi:hypothetical protein